MRDLLRSAWTVLIRAVALGWLLVAAPLELAAALAGLASRPPVTLGVLAATLVAARVLVVAGGLILGRQLAQRAPRLRPFAVQWAAADLGTLAVALATSALPSSRAPGDAPFIWLAYAGAALVVYLAAD